MSERKKLPVAPLGGKIAAKAARTNIMRLALALIGVGIVGLYLAGINPDVFFSFWPDQTDYLVFGQGISQGSGLCNVSVDPCQPFNVMHPPGMALLLALIIAGFGMHIPLIKAALILLFLLGLLLYADVMRRREPWAAGPLAALLAAAIPFGLAFSQVILADFPYVGFSLAALWSFERWERRGRPGWLAAAIGLATACFYLRPIGLAVILSLMAGVVLAAAGRRLSRRTAAAILAMMVLAFLSWFIYITVHTGYGGWSLFLDEMTAKKIGNDYVSNTFQPWTAAKIRIGYVGLYLSVASQFLLPWSWAQGWTWLPGLAAAGLIAAGWLGSWRGRRSFLETYPVFYVLVLLAWAHPEERYLYSLFAPLIYYLLVGAGVIGTRVSRRLGRALPAGLGLAVLAAALFVDAAVVMDFRPDALPNRFRLRPHEARPWLDINPPLAGVPVGPHFRMLPANEAGANLIRLELWARDNLPATSRIFVNYNNDSYLITGLKTPVFFMNQPDPLALFIEGKVDYVLIGEAYPAYSNWAMKALTREPGFFKEVMRVPGTRTAIYRFKPSR